MRDRYIWAMILAVAFVLAGFMVFMTGGFAWEQDSPYKGWADKQVVMPAARHKFSCGDAPNVVCSCCDGAEIVKTKFRVAPDNSDAWQWLNPKTRQWLLVPYDIIHWDEPTPDGQPVAFEYPIGSGTLRCFFPPNGDGG